MNRIVRPAVASVRALGALLLASCASRVWMMVPAKVDLSTYPSVGIVELEGDEPELRQRATRELQQRLLSARPGLRVIELDSLAAARGVDAVLVGTVEFSKVNPTLGLTSSLVELQARAEILGSLSVRLVEPESGATVWMSSSDRTATVASMGVDSSGGGSIGYTDVQATKVSMVAALAEDVTHDFRDQYFRKKEEDVPPHYRPVYSDGVEVYVPPDTAGD